MMESSELVFLILHAVACLSLTPVSSWQAHQNSSLCMYALFLLVRISRRISMNYPSTAGCRTDHYDCVESIENLPAHWSWQYFISCGSCVSIVFPLLLAGPDTVVLAGPKVKVIHSLSPVWHWPDTGLSEIKKIGIHYLNNVARLQYYIKNIILHCSVYCSLKKIKKIFPKIIIMFPEPVSHN